MGSTTHASAHTVVDYSNVQWNPGVTQLLSQVFILHLLLSLSFLEYHVRSGAGFDVSQQLHLLKHLRRKEAD